jgi:hypothetical protein
LPALAPLFFRGNESWKSSANGNRIANGEVEMKTIFIIVHLGLLLSTCILSFAQEKEAPANVAAAMVVKVIGFEKKVSSGDVSIYVLGAPGVATELKKLITIANLKNVESGDALPASKPSALFVGNVTKADAAVKYSRDNKILSITSLPELVAKGVTLGFGIGEDGKPKILLNLASSAAEGLDWNPAILKVARTVQ